MHKVLLENLIFYANHGVFEEETIIGGKFEVNLEVQTDFSKSMNTDNLEGTIDYSVLYSIIEEEMKTPSQLLEHLGKRIIDKVRSSQRGVENIKIKISKLNPPIRGEIGKVSIEIEE